MDTKDIINEVIKMFSEAGMPLEKKGIPCYIMAVCERVKSSEGVFYGQARFYENLAKKMELNVMTVKRQMADVMTEAMKYGVGVRLNKMLGIDVFLPCERPYITEFIALMAIKVRRTLLEKEKIPSKNINYMLN